MLQTIFKANIWIRLYIKLIKLSFKYDVLIPKLKVGYLNLPNKAADAFHKKGKRSIIHIDISKNNYSKWQQSLLHEFRHCWQVQNYYELTKWCTLKTNYDQDPIFYNYNPIEIDAKMFAISLGKNDSKFIMELFTVEELSYVYNKISFSFEFAEYIINKIENASKPKR